MVLARLCKFAPEKLEALLAAMITKSSCKVLKNIIFKGYIKDCYSVQGLLLNKLTGAFHRLMEIPVCTITPADQECLIRSKTIWWEARKHCARKDDGPPPKQIRSTRSNTQLPEWGKDINPKYPLGQDY